MRKAFTVIIGVIIGLTATARLTLATIIQLEIYNDYALVDENNTALLGNNLGGDLVQVIFAGADNTANAANADGSLGGDDSLLFTTHIGLGVGTPNAGLLDVWPINYDPSKIGTNIYIRFWNANTLTSGTYWYGNTTNLVLTLGDGFHQVVWNFAETATLPTNYQITLSVIPEPSNLFLFGIFAFAMTRALKRKKFGIA